MIVQKSKKPKKCKSSMTLFGALIFYYYFYIFIIIILYSREKDRDIVHALRPK